MQNIRPSNSRESRPTNANCAQPARLSVSVVMPTYQRRDAVSNALRALCSLDYAGAVEIIVVIDGSCHRLEKVLKIQNVQYINDSKATNVNATFFALDTMNVPTVWIVGGVDKGNDYHELMSLVREKVKAIICLGVDNKKIIDAFGNVVDIMIEVTNMNDAVKMAQRLTEKGDAVLLSPACASFDLFENYEDRGRQFKQAVHNL